MYNVKMFFIVIVVLVAIIGSGCTAIQPLPMAARAGDTVMLAVGAADGMTRDNTTVEYESEQNPGLRIDLTANIRSILKIHPDKTSHEVLFDSMWYGNITYYSSHGAWESLVVVDLPPGLPVGAGDLFVTTSAEFPSVTGSVNGVPISLEILPGTGEPNPFAYNGPYSIGQANLSSLEPLPQVVIKPPVGVQSQTYGSVEIKVKVPVKKPDETRAPDSEVRVVVDDMGYWNLVSQMQSSWVRNGNKFTVLFMSPRGLLQFFETRFSVVTKSNNHFGTSPAPSLVSIRYFDMDGYEITGPTPTIEVR